MILTMSFASYARHRRNKVADRDSYGFWTKDQWLQKAESIDGWMRPVELKLLFEAAAELPEGARVVELGCWKGRSTLAIGGGLIRTPGVQLFCVDHFTGAPNQQAGASPTTPIENGEAIYQEFLRNTEPIELIRVVLRMTSQNAAAKFENESLDWVFIDASHDYHSVLTDLQTWLPRLRPGGLISGHDYHDSSVKRAVRKMCGQVEVWDSIWYARRNSNRSPIGKLIQWIAGAKGKQPVDTIGSEEV